jgi:Concanavalin A-like lectin/glucanases superfamily
MTQAIWVILGVLAVPVVLLLATTGCAQVAGIEDWRPEEQKPSEPVVPPPDGGDGDGDGPPIVVEPPPPTYEQTVNNEMSLLGYWRLGETNGAAKAVNHYKKEFLDGDYVNGITLEQDGALLPNDKDTAALFAGTLTGGYVDVPPTMPMTPIVDGGEVTVELWAMLPDTVPDWRLLVGCYEALPFPQPDTTIAKGYRLRVRTVSDPNAMIEIEANIGGMPSPLTAQIPIDAEWHHVVLTYLNAPDPDPRIAELYIDGQLKAALTTTTGIFDLVTTQSLRFGAGYSVVEPVVTYPYPGLLDEVALYLNYLPQAEVEKHYNAQKQP